jgi:metallo-beta-lactamase class B
MLIMVMLVSAAPTLARPTETDPGPRTAVEGYFLAHAQGDPNYIRQVFSPDASVAFIDQGQIKRWTREQFAERFRAPAPDEYRRVRRIERLDVDGNVASAVVSLDYPQVRFSDHLSLLKTDDSWKIVSKAFSADHRDVGALALQETLREWSLPFEPRRLIGDIYYVGSNLISVFLIATPAGHILIDTGHAQMLPQVEANIEKLGFHVRDVKIVLNSHAHFDHCGGFAAFKRETGATLVASRLDGELMARGGKEDFYWGDDLAYAPVAPDRIVADADQVRLGNAVLTAILTPGHTQGCTSWQMTVREQGHNYRVLFLCGLTVSLYKLTNNSRYPNIAADVRATLARLKALRADVMLASHGFWFDLAGKAARQEAGAPNPFIDPQELDRHLAEMQADFAQALELQERQR